MNINDIMENKMNRYENGKIYTIRSNQSDIYYIGSTCMPLSKRFYDHKKSYKCWLNDKYPYMSSFELLKFDDVYIELLEDFKCENKNQLLKREGQLIRENKGKCVNWVIPGRTDKEYRVDNKELISQKTKQYREANKEFVNKRDKLYYQANREQKLKNKKQYYEANKEAMKQKYNCECGSINLIRHKARHEKSMKHIAWLNLEQI
jgi:hypothetical protein